MSQYRVVYVGQVPGQNPGETAHGCAVKDPHSRFVTPILSTELAAKMEADRLNGVKAGNNA